MRRDFSLNGGKIMGGKMEDIYGLKVRTIDGREQSLDMLRGKVGLIVNVASRCGFTPQYRELEAFHRQYRDRGLLVMGFPCNQFGRQEPASEQEIVEFCSLTYDVTFPLFAKIDVNGEKAHPLYIFLKMKSKGILGTESIKWNFTKFLVSRNGGKVLRYGAAVKPHRLREGIEALLAE